VALCFYVVIMLFMNQQAPLNKTAVIDEKRIDEHNQNTPWQQGSNKFFEGATLADAKKIFNASFANHPNLAKCNVDESVSTPESFDARIQWPQCMLPIANQQRTCGSSYAISATQATAERLCIASKDNKLTQLSVQELLSCDAANQGCKGGYINTALDYIRSKGVVDEQCFPYQADSDTVKCDKICPNPATRERIEGYCVLFGEEDIKKDIMKNGPVVAATQIYVDFLTYKSGVYTKGDEVAKFSGFHSVKIIGWGVESEEGSSKGNKYWLVQNSWGEDWGENGVAKIAMGQELMFDSYAYSLKVRSDKPQEPKQEKPKITKSADPDLDSDLNLDDLDLLKGLDD
jgi:cathepsin B